jgi:LytS/YehU family sensor histidine kinase
MSEYFRYSLTRDKASMVSLKEEITAVRSYLEIQGIRFGDKLDINIDVQPETLSCAVPAFSVQTLVENGIKYGLKTSDTLLHLEVRSFSRNGRLHIHVVNSGRLFHAGEQIMHNESSGTGLENLEERLKYLDPENRFRLYEENGRVVAAMDITVNQMENESLDSPGR